MDWYEVPSKTDEIEYNKALIRLLRVAMFLERRLAQAARENGHSARSLKEYRLSLMIAQRIINAWKTELGIED